MTMDEALGYVDGISILKYFPSQAGARVALAERLREWCRGTPGFTPYAQAEWLVGQVDVMDEYPGPATLRQMLTDRFYPAGAIATFKSPSPIKPDCQLCSDMGTLEETNGKHRWCTCGQAVLMKIETPDWLDTVNRMPGVRPGRKHQPRITQEHIAEAERELKAGAAK